MSPNGIGPCVRQGLIPYVNQFDRRYTEHRVSGPQWYSAKSKAYTRLK